MRSKTELRESLRVLFANKPDLREPSAALHSLNTRLTEHFNKEHSKCVGLWAAYSAMGHEPDVAKSLESLTGDFHFCFPRVEGDHLVFYEPCSREAMIKSRWGILEPDPSQSRAVEAHEMKGLIIPGLAFDTICNRLGRGRGYYDRALADITARNPKVIKVGVALEAQVLEGILPTDDFDQPMDWLVTDQRTFRRASTSPGAEERKTS